MAFSPLPTSGVGVAAQIKVQGNATPLSTKAGYNNVTLSLSATGFPATFQLNPQLLDAAGTPVPAGTPLVLTAVANASAGASVYTGTITGGAANALAGKTFVVAGFVTAANNGSFIATASSATTLTLQNGAGVAETHAATATSEEVGLGLTYYVDGARTTSTGTYKPSTTILRVATVSATGLLTAVAAGGTVAEVSYPTFANTVGSLTVGGVSLPTNKVYAEVNVTVVP